MRPRSPLPVATVTLDSNGPIGTSSNRIQFADDSNTAQQNVIIGSTSASTSVFLDGLGSLTLGNVGGSGADTQLDVTARTNLMVLAGATVNSGNSTLSLGADLKADGTGDDGVGTLSILAGALVTSSNATASAITLRGADIEINNGVNPAKVWATALPQSSAATLTGLNGPGAMAFDPRGKLYVANWANDTVSVFARGHDAHGHSHRAQRAVRAGL